MTHCITMDSKEVISILAIILGPIFAVQIQKLLETQRDKKQRRLTIFNTLMATRAERLNRDHVRALNMIDIEFYGRRLFWVRYQTQREKSVTNAWKNYNDHLNNRGESSLERWTSEGDALFTKLLYKMSISLGYEYDEVQLKRDCYRPQGHVGIDNAQLSVLLGLADVVNGARPLPIEIVQPPIIPKKE